MPRTVRHTVPLMGPALSLEAAKGLSILLREPRQEARGAGGRAYYEGGDNPFTAGTPEAINWQAGWDYERGQNS